MSKLSEWGQAVWLLFHTIGNKIDEEYLKNNNKQITNLITNICNNLPCPSCKEHAITTLRNARLENIRSKNDLQYFFWSFHNIVNKSLNKEFFSQADLEIYKNTHTKNVIYNFKIKFTNRPYNDKLLIDKFIFNNMKDKIYSYLDFLVNNNYLQN